MWHPLLAAVGSLTGPLVPSGAQNCPAGFAAFAQLVGGVLGALVSLGLLILVLVLAYAGFLLILTPANSGNREQAKKMLLNAAVGFMLTLAAWIAINTLLSLVGAGGIAGATSDFFNGGGTCLLAKTQSQINGGGGTGSGTGSGSGSGSGNGSGSGECPGNLICGSDNKCTTDPDLDQGDGSAGAACTSPGSQGNCQSGLICDATDVCATPPGAQNPGSCQGGTPGGGGDTGLAQKIYQASQSYYGTDTSAGPDHGRLACAWSVNNVLSSAGISHIDDNSVASMEAALKGGRGTLVSLSSAVAGDILIEAGDGHVGICQNSGCSSVLSNSSSRHAFVWYSGPDFLPSYHNGVGRAYHVNN